jgi:hypothetical protein
MNQRNVEALAALLARSPWEIVLRDEDRRAVDEDAVSTTLAEWLASRGVLVPSALTDEDAAVIGRTEARAGFLALNVSRALDRIAKGET